MKRIIFLIMGLLLVTLSACTPMIYGVPQETWDGMNQEQRAATIEIYKERQLARQRAAEERARQHAIYLEEQRLKEAAEAEALRYQIEAIYRGDGNYGDLLRVRIENGTAYFRGQIRQYDPVAFQLAKGEIKDITITTTKNRRVTLTAYYDGATLFLDGNKNTRQKNMSKILYDKRWSHGLTYTDVYTNNKAKLKGAEVTVEIVGGKRNGARYPSSGATTIIIKEQPSKVIVYGNSKDDVIKQRQKREQLKKERRAIEKEREALKREQAKFEAEQLALENERAELEKKRARIKKMKKETAREKKHAAQEKQQQIEEREQAVKELEEAVQAKEKTVARKEKTVAKKEKQVKEKQQKIKKQQKMLEKEVEQIEKELSKEVTNTHKENNGKNK